MRRSLSPLSRSSWLVDLLKSVQLFFRLSGTVAIDRIRESGNLPHYTCSCFALALCRPPLLPSVFQLMSCNGNAPRTWACDHLPPVLITSQLRKTNEGKAGGAPQRRFCFLQVLALHTHTHSWRRGRRGSKNKETNVDRCQQTRTDMIVPVSVPLMGGHKVITSSAVASPHRLAAPCKLASCSFTPHPPPQTRRIRERMIGPVQLGPCLRCGPGRCRSLCSARLLHREGQVDLSFAAASEHNTVIISSATRSCSVPLALLSCV